MLDPLISAIPGGVKRGKISTGISGMINKLRTFSYAYLFTYLFFEKYLVILS
jgi:hypothetical protein